MDLELQDRGLSDKVGVDHTVQGQSTQQQVDTIDARIEKLLNAQANLKPGLQFGYQIGFTIASPEGVKIGTGAPLSMRINSWFQFRHTGFASHRSSEDQNDLEFERLRLTFQGNVYTPDLKYFIQFDGDDDQAQVSDWLDYYIRYDFGHALPFHIGYVFAPGSRGGFSWHPPVQPVVVRLDA